MTKNYIAALVLLLATALPGSAINPYRRYDTRNGLSDNSVKDICQDSRGYMWFATKDGFNRFNGYRFDVFGSSFSGEHLNIDVICPHSDGIRIWLGCTEALMLFDPRDERLTRFDARNSEGKGIRNCISLLYDPLGDPVDRNRRRAVPLGRTHRPPLPLRTGGERRRHVPRDPDHLRGQRRRNLGRDDRRTVPLPPQDGPLRPECEAQAGEFPAGRQRDHGHRRGRRRQTADRHAERLPRRIRHLHGPVHAIPRLRRRGKATLRRAHPHDFPAGHEPLHDRFGQRPFLLQPQERPAGRSPETTSPKKASTGVSGDREGGIWIGTYFCGVNYLSPRQDEILWYYDDGRPESLDGNAVSQFCDDGPGEPLDRDRKRRPEPFRRPQPEIHQPHRPQPQQPACPLHGRGRPADRNLLAGA